MLSSGRENLESTLSRKGMQVVFWFSSNALYLYVGYDRQWPSTVAASAKAYKGMLFLLNKCLEVSSMKC